MIKNGFFILIFLGLIISGCLEKPAEKINLSIVQDPDIIKNDTSIKVAIASVISPKESFVYYEKMISYISKKLGMPVKIVQRRSYEEINDLIKNKQIDFAFVCSGAYVEGNSQFGMKLLVAPQAYGKTTYNSYIIVQKNSSYTNLSDLRGRKFAFTDPISNTGKLYPTYKLALMNETPESFFGVDGNGRNNTFYSYSHDNSIIAVAENLADGAAVHSLVYEYMKNTKPDIISTIKIIEISPPFGNPPVVVSSDIDPFLEQKLRDIFIDMDKDEEGRTILASVKIDRFVNIDDSAYNKVREMRDFTR